MWFIGVEVQQETSAPPPKKDPGSAPAADRLNSTSIIRSAKILRLSTESSFSINFIKILKHHENTCMVKIHVPAF